MSARDIEGENPLYLPQAKVYNQCCALGPCVLIPEEPLDRAATRISLIVVRKRSTVLSRRDRSVADGATASTTSSAG